MTCLVAAALAITLTQTPPAEEPNSDAKAAPAKAVISLAESVQPFREQFNSRSDEIRFLAVLSPS